MALPHSGDREVTASGVRRTRCHLDENTRLGACTTVTLDWRAEKHARRMQRPASLVGTPQTHDTSTPPARKPQGTTADDPEEKTREDARGASEGGGGPAGRGRHPALALGPRRTHGSAQEPRRGRAGGRQGAPSRALGPRRRLRSRKAADRPATEEGTDGGQRLADEGVSLQRHGGRVAKGRGTPHTQAVTPFTQNRAAGTGTGARVARDAHTAAGGTTARDARRTSGPLSSALPRQRAWGAVMAVAPETPQI